MIRTDIYIGSSKESMWNKAVELGLSGEALMSFRYACCEVKLTIDVDEQTGDAVIVAVDGRPLASDTHNAAP